MELMATENETLREEALAALADPVIQALLRAPRSGPGAEPDPRALYRELGRRRLLAVNFPEEYGGRGASHEAAAAVFAALVRGGVPETLHVLSVQIVGLFLLLAGTESQKATHLAALGAGERFATVLYTEPDVGSDLAALTTTASPTGDGWLITGEKVFGMKSSMADFALCAARTGVGASKYQHISLFLVDLASPGVSRTTVPSIADEHFDRVVLDGVYVPASAMVGEEGQGWALLTRCLAIERTGLDYWLKAERWLDAALEGIGEPGEEGSTLELVGRYGAAVDTSKLLVDDVIAGIGAGHVDETAAAAAKYHASETAQRVARWAAGEHGFGYASRNLPVESAAVLESAYREAPGVTLAAGSSQMMLELVGAAVGEHRREADV